MKNIKTTVKNWDFGEYNIAHQCHENSYKYCLDNEGCKFVVGKIKKSDIPHCIVKLPNGEYIDPTFNQEIEYVVIEEYEIKDIIKIFAREGMYFIPNMNDDMSAKDVMVNSKMETSNILIYELEEVVNKINNQFEENGLYQNLLISIDDVKAEIESLNISYDDLNEDSLNDLIEAVECVEYDLSEFEYDTDTHNESIHSKLNELREEINKMLRMRSILLSK